MMSLPWSWIGSAGRAVHVLYFHRNVAASWAHPDLRVYQCQPPQSRYEIDLFHESQDKLDHVNKQWRPSWCTGSYLNYIVMCAVIECSYCVQLLGICLTNFDRSEEVSF